MFKRFFRRKANKESPQPRLREDEYFVEKRRNACDGTSRTIETSLDDILSHLERISLFKSEDDYVLPGAQTSVKASESESGLYLVIRTTKPLDYCDSLRYSMIYGHEFSLAELLKKYDFNPTYGNVRKSLEIINSYKKDPSLIEIIK